MRQNKEDFTLKGMKFEFNFGNLNFKREDQGSFYFAEDKSLIYKKSGGDFTVLLSGNWRLELIIDSITGKCIKFQCFLDEIQYEESKLSIPDSLKGVLYFRSDEEIMPASGCHYYPFENKVIYDKEKKIMCIGSKEEGGQAIEFAEGIIAVVEKEQLKKLYLKLPKSFKMES